MKKILFTILLTIVSYAASAQIPYFAEANGAKSVYGYFEFGFHPGINANDIDTYWQYGATKWLDAGFEFSNAEECSELAPSVKASHSFSQWFGISGMVRPWFAVSDNFKFEGMTVMGILQGSITRNGKLFWLTNTEFGFINDYDGTSDQLWNIGYTFELKNGDTIMPMGGITHTWQLDSDVCPTIGVNYSHDWLGVYLWGSELLANQPRIGIALDIKF